MPPTKKLTARADRRPDAVGQDGRPWPGADKAAAAAARKGEMQITDKDRDHWAFQPVKRPAVPDGQERGLGRAIPIDAFILAKLEAKGLTPNPPADQARADPPASTST